MLIIHNIPEFGNGYKIYWTFNSIYFNIIIIVLSCIFLCFNICNISKNQLVFLFPLLRLKNTIILIYFIFLIEIFYNKSKSHFEYFLNYNHILPLP